MSELICREDALDALKKIMFTHLFECGEYINEDTREFSIMNAEKALDVIENLPFIEPKQKKGRWQRRKDEDCWECSECHAVLENSDIENHNFYYCYHCGADMMDICGYIDLEKVNYE